VLLCFTVCVCVCVVCNNLPYTVPVTLLSGVLAFSPAYRTEQGHVGAHDLVSVSRYSVMALGEDYPPFQLGKSRFDQVGLGIGIQPLWCGSGLLTRSVTRACYHVS